MRSRWLILRRDVPILAKSALRRRLRTAVVRQVLLFVHSFQTRRYLGLQFVGILKSDKRAFRLPSQSFPLSRNNALAMTCFGSSTHSCSRSLVLSSAYSNNLLVFSQALYCTKDYEDSTVQYQLVQDTIASYSTTCTRTKNTEVQYLYGTDQQMYCTVLYQGTALHCTGYLLYRQSQERTKIVYCTVLYSTQYSTCRCVVHLLGEAVRDGTRKTLKEGEFFGLLPYRCFVLSTALQSTGTRSTVLSTCTALLLVQVPRSTQSTYLELEEMNNFMPHHLKTTITPSPQYISKLQSLQLQGAKICYCFLQVISVNVPSL